MAHKSAGAGLRSCAYGQFCMISGYVVTQFRPKFVRLGPQAADTCHLCSTAVWESGWSRLVFIE